MADESILSIVLRARDEASKTIGEVADKVDQAGKNAMNMGAAFKVAGGLVLGAGVAGVGIMKDFADAASQHQVAMASVDATLKNVSSSMGTATVVIGGATGSVKENKKAIQEQIQALQDQKAQLTINNAEQTQSITVTTGHGKTLKEHTKIVHENQAAINAQKLVIDQQILSLKESEQGVSKSGSTTGGVTKIIDNATMSYANLTKIANNLSDSYLKLGFVDHDTQLAFAQDVRVTKDVADAKTMLAASADLARLKNVDLGTATTALTMAYEGNTRSLKALGIEVPKGSKGMENITAVEKAAAGQAEAFSKTYEGASEVLRVNVEKLKVTLGERLLPTLSGFMQSITGVIERLNSLSPKTYDTIINVLKFGTAFALIAGPLLLAIGFLPTLKLGFMALSGAILPLTLILGGVALVGYLLYENWGQVEKIFSSVGDTLKGVFDKLAPGIRIISDALHGFDPTLKPSEVATWLPLVKAINDVKTAIQIIQTVFSGKMKFDLSASAYSSWLPFIRVVIQVRDTIKTVSDGISTAIKIISIVLGGPSLGLPASTYSSWLPFARTVLNVKDTIIAVAKDIVSTVGNMLATIVQFWKDHGTVIMTQVKLIWDKTVAAFNAILAVVGPVLQGLLGLVILVVGLIYLWITSHWQQIQESTKFAFDLIMAIIKGALDVITGIFKIAGDIMKGNWTGVLGDIKDLFVNIWHDIEQVVKDAINSMIKYINNLIVGANAIGSKIHLPAIPTIPQFEQGGYVPSTGIAMLHQGEFVLSKDMLSGRQPAPSYVTNNTTSQPINIYATINTEMDLALLGNKVAFAVRNSR